jgi:hypothetical protein
MLENVKAGKTLKAVANGAAGFFFLLFVELCQSCEFLPQCQHSAALDRTSFVTGMHYIFLKYL